MFLILCCQSYVVNLIGSSACWIEFLNGITKSVLGHFSITFETLFKALVGLFRRINVGGPLCM